MKAKPAQPEAGTPQAGGGGGGAPNQEVPDTDKAISFATSQVKGTNPIPGSGGTWAYYCLGLVQLAYGGRHAGLTGVGDAYSAYQRYASKAQQGDPSKIPRGALIFWDWTSAQGEHWGHIGICMGGDQVVSTSASTGGVAVTTISGFHLPFLGWAAP